MSIKEMMQDPNAKKLPQPKDCLDDFSQEAQQKYNFFLTLFKLVRSKKALPIINET